jgi:hypothetical protein
MKVRNYCLSWALAAAMVVFGYGGAALAQVPTPAGTPSTANPAGHPPVVVVPQGGTRPNIIPVSPEALRKAEEHARKYGHFTLEPPHPAKHWPNGVPPERYHRTAPPPSFPPGGGAAAFPPLGWNEQRTAELG